MSNVTIEGSLVGSEREAAERLASLLEPVLPRDAELLLIVEARLPGADLQQIDILLIGLFPSGLTIKLADGRTAVYRDMFLTIEVKELSGSRVKNTGTTLLGLYEEGWKDLSRQSDQQKILLAKTLSKKPCNVRVRVENLIWLVNHIGSIPDSMPFVLKGDFDGRFFLQAVARLREPRSNGEPVTFEYGQGGDLARLATLQRVTRYFTTEIQETRADRKRWEAVMSRDIDSSLYLNKDLGKLFLIVRGLAGSGKTIHLMRIAKALFDKERSALLLTYNHALKQDIRRLFAINGVKNGREVGVHVSTADKFFKDLLVDWNMYDSSLKYEDRMSSGKVRLLELVKSSDDDPESLQKQSPSIYADYVLIDEAQDWPEDERDLLFSFFGKDHLVIADGGDQLIRRNSRCEWTKKGEKQRRFIDLKKSLRMGRNISRFVKAFCVERGMNWEQEIVYSNYPGKITMIDGQYNQELHRKIMAEHKSDGNEPLDALFCVWKEGGGSHPLIGQFSSWGLDFWDGTSKEGKDTFPTHYTQHRIVNYRSCRGLEGWTVVCVGLDTYLGDRYKRALDAPHDLLSSPEEHAKQQATLEALIPLTRAVNHLVIQFDGKGLFRQLCRVLYEKNKDYITWVQTTGKA